MPQDLSEADVRAVVAEVDRIARERETRVTLVETRRILEELDLPSALLEEALAAIRERLYDVSMDETLLGISAVAAPILNFDNELVGALAVVGTTQYVHEPVDPEQLKLLRACTKAISLKLNSTAYEGLGIPNLKEFIFD